MADTAALEAAPIAAALPTSRDDKALHRLIFIGIALLLIVAPLVLYPVYLMKVLCFALFALAFNLLLGYGGLLSFGHAAYFGMASYVCAYTAKNWGLTPELAILLGTAVYACVRAVLATRSWAQYDVSARHLLLQKLAQASDVQWRFGVPQRLAPPGAGPGQ